MAEKKLSEQNEGRVQQAIESEEFNVTNGLERRFLEGDKEVTENFKTGRAVFTRDFLEGWLADQIHEFMAITSPSDWWSFVSAETVGGNDQTARTMTREVFQIQAENKGERDSMWYEAMRSLKEGKFSYAYSQQKGNYPGKGGVHGEAGTNCNCYICNTHENGIFRPNGEFEAAMTKIVGEPVELIGLQWTRFSANDFLAPHTDDSNGKYAFVLNFTKDWRPTWGGNLTFYGPDGYILDTAPTVFNSLTLFEVGSNDNYHGVSPVIPTLNKNRYAISGWVHPKSDKKSVYQEENNLTSNPYKL